jgi:hypothetical protein
MPEYIYKHPEREEYIELIQSVNDEHVFHDEDGLKWDRSYTPINFSTHSKIDAFDKVAFTDKTGKMKGTYGDMLDYSKELSIEREERLGYDPVKKSYFEKYEKEVGNKHVEDKPKTNLENDFASIID